MMDGDALGDALRAAVDAIEDKTDRAAIFRALGAAIVTHIQTNAVVSTTGTAAEHEPGAAAPVVSTGTIE